MHSGSASMAGSEWVDCTFGLSLFVCQASKAIPTKQFRNSRSVLRPVDPFFVGSIDDILLEDDLPHSLSTAVRPFTRVYDD